MCLRRRLHKRLKIILNVKGNNEKGITWRNSFFKDCSMYKSSFYTFPIIICTKIHVKEKKKKRNFFVYNALIYFFYFKIQEAISQQPDPLSKFGNETVYAIFTKFELTCAHISRFCVHYLAKLEKQKHWLRNSGIGCTKKDKLSTIYPQIFV